MGGARAGLSGLGVGGAGRARAAAAASFPHARRKWRLSARRRVVVFEAVVTPVRGRRRDMPAAGEEAAEPRRWPCADS